MGQSRNAVRAAAGFLLIVMLLGAVCALTAQVRYFMAGKPTAVPAAVGRAVLPVIVVDAGHGGMDGGAVGVDGSVEKEINLVLAKKLRAMLEFAGFGTVMTREDDRMLIDGSVTSKKKMHDLKNRLAVVRDIRESGKEAVLVSIHMNNFTESRYSGLQVWYAGGDEGSASLASTVQSYARTFLDKNNTREIKKATSAIYLLDRADFPAVLIECGFLSNPEECAKLGTDEYQTELALTIFAAISEYFRNF